MGHCPHCGFAAARGDQCDGCGALLDPTELISPRSALSGDTALEVKESRQLFLRQSLLVDRLREWLDAKTGWPPIVASLARSWLTSELRDRCITRDLAWGVPVPRPGFENKVFYVWFDAPIGYIAATKEWADAETSSRNWRRWWQEAGDVRYLQFLGKDNIPFQPSASLDLDRLRRALEIRRRHQGIPLVAIRGREILHQRQARHIHGQSSGRAACGLLALQLIANAPETSDADFESPAFRQRGEQGSGARVRQSRQSHDPLRPPRIRGTNSRGRRARRVGEGVGH